MKIKIGQEELYTNWKNKNKDFYGHACFEYAERWANLLEEKINVSPNEAENIIIKHAKKLSYEANTESITGFMYGCAVSILSQCWEYGEYLRRWHNNEYDYEGYGVVNPAIINIKAEHEL